MYSYKGQGSPAVVSYQYGTERYVRDDKYNGLDIQTFDPRPQVHTQPQNNPMLHRQNIEKSGMMPMQRGQANVFPVDNGKKGLSYASSNLDSYQIVDKHSATGGFSPLASMEYLRDNDDDQKQIYMQTRLNKFQDFKVNNYYYRIFENGLIQILSPSATMVGRIISEEKRPKLYHAILKSIHRNNSQEYNGIGSKIKEAWQTRKDKKESSGDNLQAFIKSDFNTQLTKFKALPESVKPLFLQQLKNIGYQELTERLTNPLIPTQNALPSTSTFNKEEEESNKINKYLLIGGSIVGALFIFKVLSK